MNNQDELKLSYWRSFYLIKKVFPKLFKKSMGVLAQFSDDQIDTAFYWKNMSMEFKDWYEQNKKILAQYPNQFGEDVDIRSEQYKAQADQMQVYHHALSATIYEITFDPIYDMVMLIKGTQSKLSASNGTEEIISIAPLTIDCINQLDKENLDFMEYNFTREIGSHFSEKDFSFTLERKGDFLVIEAEDLNGKTKTKKINASILDELKNLNLKTYTAQSFNPPPKNKSNNEFEQ